jgi:hypothetical protein
MILVISVMLFYLLLSILHICNILDDLICNVKDAV